MAAAGSRTSQMEGDLFIPKLEVVQQDTVKIRDPLAMSRLRRRKEEQTYV